MRQQAHKPIHSRTTAAATGGNGHGKKIESVRLSLLLALFLLTPREALRAQEQPKISVEVKVVNVLATVRDKQGKIVTNLGKDDFVLEEDGHPQTITYFSRESDLPLTLGLLVGTSGSQRRVLDQESNASYSFLDYLLREKDLACVIHFDREVELLQDLTSSHKKLQEALGHLNEPSFSSGSSGSGGSRGSYGGGGTLLYDAVYLGVCPTERKNDVLATQCCCHRT